MTPMETAIHSKDMKGKLPDGWRWVRLGEVCEIIAGQSPPSSTYRNIPEGLPFFQGKADFGLLNPVPRVWCIEPNKVALPGDILISVRAPVGPTNISNVKCCIGRGLAAIRCENSSDRDFILSAIRHFESMLIEKGTGSTFQAINRHDLERLSIPLPPLPEQQRIAAILNDQMALVEKARAAAQARLEAIKALSAAFLRQVFPQPGQTLSDGWRWVKLDEVAEVISGQHILESDYNRNGRGIGYLTGPADFGAIKPNITKWTENPRAICEPMDVLVTVKGAGVGKINLSPDVPAAISRQLMAIRGFPDLVDTVFLYSFLETCLAHFQGNAIGATVPGLSREDIKTLSIPLPPLPEQQRIAAILKDQIAAVERARAVVEEELATINALPASLLRRAFSGKL